MSRDGLNRLLSWLVVIVLGIQINHFLANRSDLDPFFDIAFYPDNGGLAVYFGAVLSTVLMFPLIYLTRWRAAVVPDCGWAGKIFRPNMLELDETMPLGKSILRVLFVAGVILPMIGHVWLVHRWIFKDPDVYIRICEEKTVNGEKIPFKDQTVVELYPEVCGTDDTYKKKLTGRSDRMTPGTASTVRPDLTAGSPLTGKGISNLSGLNPFGASCSVPVEKASGLGMMTVW